MGFKDFFKKEETNTIDYTPLIVINEAEARLSNIVNPQFKGEVEQEIIKFPHELGVKHPFDFKTAEELYKKFGFVTAVIDKFIDFVVGPGFFIECEDERAKEIINKFMEDINFDTLIRSWIKEALIKGNGFLEISGGDSIKGLKVLNANYMYVVRDDKGVIKGYNQYTGGFKRLDKSKIIPFKEHEIGHLPFNKVGDCPYGNGIISPAFSTIDNLIQNQKDMHMLMGRKANSPYVVKMGGVVGGKYYKPNPTDVEAFGRKLEWLHNKHEWTVDGLTDIKALDFGNIGEKFDSILEYDVNMLFYTFQIPAVIMGMARIPEGLAKVQMDAFERRINSIQAEVEKVIEQEIFSRILKSNGFDVHVEFEWGRPSNMERYERLNKITEMMKIMGVSNSLRKLMEKDIVRLMNYNEEEYEVMSEEEEKERELERQQPIVPGQNQSPPQTTTTKQPQPKPEENLHDDFCPHCLDIKEGQYNKIEEWLGFNYKKYLKNILDVIGEEKFVDLAATTDVEEMAGKLTVNQISKLKDVLNDGIKKGSSMNEIALNIENKVKPKDLFKLSEGEIVKDTTGLPVLSKAKEWRNMAIARSEITRVSNAGAVKYFEKEGVKKLRWIASYGSRTCPICEGLNNQIFNINNVPDLPQHTMCRCTLLPLQEVL